MRSDIEQTLIPLQILIIDDDEKDLRAIETCLSELRDGMPFIFQIHTCTAYTENADDHYDLYIIDVAMHPRNGFETAEEICRLHNEATIIFCTSHDQLVFDSFQYHVFYFVRKHSLKEDMSKALSKYRNYHASHSQIYRYQFRGISRMIPYTDILYFEVFHNTVFIHLTDGSQLRQRCSLSSVEESLVADCFLRISQCYLLNMQYIQEIRGNTASFKTLSFQISAGYQKSAAKRFGDYILNSI